MRQQFNLKSLSIDNYIKFLGTLVDGRVKIVNQPKVTVAIPPEEPTEYSSEAEKRFMEPNEVGFRLLTLSKRIVCDNGVLWATHDEKTDNIYVYPEKPEGEILR